MGDIELKVMEDAIGVKDKKGIEVRNDDIVKYRGVNIKGEPFEQTGIVTYNDDDAGYGVNTKMGSLAFALFELNSITDFEIIGNYNTMPVVYESLI